MRIIGLALLAGCVVQGKPDGSDTATTSPYTENSPGPATGTWQGTCAGTATYTTQSQGTTVTIQASTNVDLTMDLSEVGPGITGEIEFTTHDTTVTGTQTPYTYSFGGNWVVVGDRFGDEIDLAVDRYTSTPGTGTTVIPVSFALVQSGDHLDGQMLLTVAYNTYVSYGSTTYGGPYSTGVSVNTSAVAIDCSLDRE